MDKEIEENIKPVKTCCGGKPYVPDPNCCVIVCNNTLPFGVTRRDWKSYSDEQKHSIAIANNWQTHNCKQVIDIQPKYNPNEELSFRPN